MNQEQLERILHFLQWKLKHNKLNIDEAKVARYLKISIIEATNIFSKLYDMRAIIVDERIYCPSCNHDYIINDVNETIICTECGSSFAPLLHKNLIKYFYRINESYKDFKKEEVKPKLSVVSKLTQGDYERMSVSQVRVFLSYCHADEDFKNKLNKHLAPLKRCNKVKEWDDRQLIVGTLFEDTIKKHLQEDEIIILLISSDFINSDYCYNVEMEKAIERAKIGTCKIIPIIIRPCLWQITPLKDFLALPEDGKPISTYENEDLAYLEIVTELNKQIQDFGL